MVSEPRFIAVGDVHGELEKFQQILRTENLIDSENHWCGDNALLLQIGDMVDRGPHSVEAIAFMRQLQQEAPKSGGRVIRLFGNHELMIMQGVYYYCNFENPGDLGDEIRREIIEGKIQTAFAWKKRLYVHAGLRIGMLERITEDLSIQIKELTQHYEDIADYLNEVAKEAVADNEYHHPVFWVDASRGGRDEYGGVFWSHYPDLQMEGLNPIRQVVGHTPPFEKTKFGIRWTKDCNKINIDAGLYSGYGGNQAWLVVEDDHVKGRTLWKKKVIEKVIE